MLVAFPFFFFWLNKSPRFSQGAQTEKELQGLQEWPTARLWLMACGVKQALEK